MQLLCELFTFNHLHTCVIIKYNYSLRLMYTQFNHCHLWCRWTEWIYSTAIIPLWMISGLARHIAVELLIFCRFASKLYFKWDWNQKIYDMSLKIPEKLKIKQVLENYNNNYQGKLVTYLSFVSIVSQQCKIEQRCKIQNLITQIFRSIHAITVPWVHFADMVVRYNADYAVYIISRPI